MSVEKEELMREIENIQALLKQTKGLMEIKNPVICNGGGVLGKVKYLVKRLIRKSIYWFLKGYLEQQVEFNSSINKAVESIFNLQCRMLDVPVEKKNEHLSEINSYKGTRVFQYVAALNYGDAVGNDALAIQELLRKNNYVTAIYTNFVHPKFSDETAYYINELPKLRESDLIIYHFATADTILNVIKNAPCKVILRYHNVTPPHFFKGYDTNVEKNTTEALKQVEELVDRIDYCLVDSEFNKKDLESIGYKCPIYVSPILIQFEDYKKVPAQHIIQKYSDGKANIIFVGRMAPNKKIEDIISAFAVYKKQYDKDARLFLVGGYNEQDKYYRFLKKHIEQIDVQDVIFSGHVPFEEILAYYAVADLFLCMSEHEGFCVPLVEAMFFKVPIVAYSSTAIPYTLKDAGVLVQEKNYSIIAQTMNHILTNSELKEDILEQQIKRLRDFDNNLIGKEMLENISIIINGKEKL